MINKQAVKSLFILFLSQAFALLAEKETQNLHGYIWANYKHAAGNLDEAQKWYDTLFASNHAPIHIYKGYLNLLRDTGKFQKIVHLIPKLETHKSISNDPTIQLIFIQALEKTGHQNEAINRLIKTNNNHKSHQEIAFFTTNLYLQRKELKNALIVIDNFLDSSPTKPNNFMFYFLKGQILLNLDKKDEAREQIKNCLDIQPHFDKGWLLYALIEEKQNKLSEAIKAYTTYLDLCGGNKEIERHLLHLIFKQKMNAQQQQRLSIDSSILKRTLLFFEQKKYQEAIEQLQQHLNQNRYNMNMNKHVYRFPNAKKEFTRIKNMLTI